MYVEGVSSIISIGINRNVQHFDSTKLLFFLLTYLYSIVRNCVYNAEVLFLKILHYDRTSFDRFSAKWAVKRRSVIRITIVSFDKIIIASFMELMCNMAGELGNFVVKSQYIKTKDALTASFT